MSNEPYEYKGYIPESELHDDTKTPPKPLPEDIKSLFNYLNTTGLNAPRDPLCVDLNYTKNKCRWSIVPQEKRIIATPEKTADAFSNWYENEWKKKSILSKLLSILWHLPAHLYRKYLASVDYRFYYNGLVSFLNRKREKL